MRAMVSKKNLMCVFHCAVPCMLWNRGLYTVLVLLYSAKHARLLHCTVLIQCCFTVQFMSVAVLNSHEQSCLHFHMTIYMYFAVQYKPYLLLHFTVHFSCCTGLFMLLLIKTVDVSFMYLFVIV
jgi:hypothetical protein